MKITIDTKEDSHDEIQKVIRLLQHLVEAGENAPSSVIPQENNTRDLFGLFSDDNEKETKDDDRASEVPDVMTY